MAITRRGLLGGAGGLALQSARPAAAASGPAAVRWAFWDRVDAGNPQSIPHAAWQEFLARYLVPEHPSGIARVRYAEVDDADREALQDYLRRLASLDPRGHSAAEQQAFWINLYNALTVELVLAHYPVGSIREIYGGLFNRGPWDEPLTSIAGQRLTLNDIEHRILRPIFADPRIHYAVNCASLGCPNLAAQAYTAANLEALLDAGARAYVNHPRGVRFDGERLELSSLYDWYAVDFGGDLAGVRAHLVQFAEPALAARLRAHAGSARYAYDWRLNAP